MITVLFPRTQFVYFFTGMPFFVSRHRKELSFTSDTDFVLKKDRNRTIILVRWFFGNHPHTPRDPIAFLAQLRQKYDRIVLFDDGDSTSSDLLHLLPHVDLFLRKQVFRDSTEYLRSRRGNRLFAEYYVDRFGVEGAEPPFAVTTADQLPKIRPAWHLGVGLYPSRYWKESLVEAAYPIFGTAAVRSIFRTPRRSVSREPKKQICQARFTAKGYTASIGYQRTLFQEKTAGNPRIVSGFISKKDYLAEMNDAAAVLSPFGWGEVCYRDFEAFFKGSVLVKPKMDHVLSWPDSYRSWETYVPTEWDGSDVESAVDRVLDDPILADQMRNRAFEEWRQAFDQLDDRVETVLKWCLGSD